MSTALEQMHEVEPHIQVGRARLGVIMLIISDALSVVAILAAGGYLTALNVSGQFRDPHEHAPAFVPGLLLAIAMVLSGLFYFWWERGVKKNENVGNPLFFILALLLMLVALVGQTWVAVTLGYAEPFHAYASLILLQSWFTSVHFLLTVIVGILLLGRIMRGRLVGHGYIVEVSGYWWYYTVIASLLLWLFSLLLA
ncbi:MAG TPA: hypothetical protein VGN34_03435 [Ktedonobacteraceae bacterium]|jgi:hypothetical protein